MLGRGIKKVGYQLIAPLEGRGNILEFLDDSDNEFMEINIDENGIRYVTIYKTKEHISLSLKDLEKGIEIAKNKVTNVSSKDLYEYLI